MKTVRINRNRWARGKFQGSEYDGFEAETTLFDSLTETACCLGHAIHQVNRCSWNELIYKGYPNDFYIRKSFLTDNFGCNNIFAKKAIEINDSTHISEATRERKLIALFKKNGIRLVFYGPKAKVPKKEIMV